MGPMGEGRRGSQFDFEERKGMAGGEQMMHAGEFGRNNQNNVSGIHYDDRNHSHHHEEEIKIQDPTA
jgi:hypothetical protein